MPFKNSVVIGHWHKNAKVTAMKQQIAKKRKATKGFKGNNLTHEAYNTIALYAWVC
jgi:hypothetical protein